MYPCNDACKLPTLRFIGGSTKTLIFSIYNERGEVFDMSACSANIAVVHTSYKQGTPLFSLPMSLVDGTTNVISVTLTPEKTVGLSGKFIYQISIMDDEGVAEEPRQGELYIDANIDKNFIKGS